MVLAVIVLGDASHDAGQEHHQPALGLGHVVDQRLGDPDRSQGIGAQHLFPGLVVDVAEAVRPRERRQQEADEPGDPEQHEGTSLALHDDHDGSHPAVEGCVFRHDGDYWTVRFAGVECALFDDSDQLTLSRHLETFIYQPDALGRRVLDDTGAPRKVVVLAVNGETLARDRFDTTLQDGDRMTLLIPVAGG